MLIELEDLLGCPFKVHGRDKKGFDCYGLVIAVEKKLGRNLIDLTNPYTQEDYMDYMENTSSQIIKQNELVETEQLQLGDIILFFDETGKSTHVGVFLKNQDFIHCDKYGVRISQLDNYFRKVWKGYTYGRN